jgi:LacI family transcriptional regulator
VVGYDNLANAQFAYPPLTTIDSHAVEQGELVAFAALALMDGETVGSQQDLMQLDLIVRESCGAKLRKVRTRTK